MPSFSFIRDGVMAKNEFDFLCIKRYVYNLYNVNNFEMLLENVIREFNKAYGMFHFEIYSKEAGEKFLHVSDAVCRRNRV